MPKISNKAQRMPASPIRKLVPFADEAKRRGTKIYHLNIGQPDIETPSTLLNAVKQNNLKVVEYSNSAGIESYRKKLATYYKSHKINVDYTDILITTGGSEALQFASILVLMPVMKLLYRNHFMPITMDLLLLEMLLLNR